MVTRDRTCPRQPRKCSCQRGADGHTMSNRALARVRSMLTKSAAVDSITNATVLRRGSTTTSISLHVRVLKGPWHQRHHARQCSSRLSRLDSTCARSSYLASANMSLSHLTHRYPFQTTRTRSKVHLCLPAAQCSISCRRMSHCRRSTSPSARRHTNRAQTQSAHGLLPSAKLPKSCLRLPHQPGAPDLQTGCE